MTSWRVTLIGLIGMISWANVATAQVVTSPGSPVTIVAVPPGGPGMTVVTPTAGGGSVTALGCHTVIVSGAPTLVGPGGEPCATSPYPTYAPYLPADPYTSRYAPDKDRRAALIATSIVYGIGVFTTGIGFAITADESSSCNSSSKINCSDLAAARTSWMVAYGMTLSVLPSIPRFVVGDSSGGLLYTGIRAAMFISSQLIPWGEKDANKFLGPFTLAFAAPLALGIVDLALTPHREDLTSEKATSAVTSRPRLAGIGAYPLVNAAGTHGAAVNVMGLF